MTEEEAQDYRQLKEQCKQQQQPFQFLDALLLLLALRIEEMEKRLAKDSHMDHGCKRSAFIGSMSMGQGG